MAWEKELDEVDKALGVHRIVLINRNVTTLDGQPQRHVIEIVLGSGTDGASCPHCNAPIERNLALGADGALRHKELGERRPADIVKEEIRKLEEFHARMEAYAQRHQVPIYKGPKNR